MKLAAITTFPPSSGPLSSFGFEAIKRFLERNEVERIIVLGDVIDGPELTPLDKRLAIERCWRPNSLLNIFTIVRAVAREGPDVVWLNLQYNLFGPSLLAAFLGLFVPICINHLGIRTVVLLHNYFAAVDLNELGISNLRFLKCIMRAVDPVILHSLSTANQVFVMRDDYRNDLSRRCPRMRVKFVEQDLYEAAPFCPIDHSAKNVLALGVWGTYKKLEVLLEAFQLVRQTLPEATLLIAGKSHPQTPNYLANLFKSHADQLANVIFLGYVANEALPALYQRANIVVQTSCVVPGSSSVIRYAAACGRGVVVPDVLDYRGMRDEAWGVVEYRSGDSSSLRDTLHDVLANRGLQDSLGLQNHKKATSFRDQFIREHAEVLFSGTDMDGARPRIANGL